MLILEVMAVHHSVYLVLLVILEDRGQWLEPDEYSSFDRMLRVDQQILKSNTGFLSGAFLKQLVGRFGLFQTRLLNATKNGSIGDGAIEDPMSKQEIQLPNVADGHTRQPIHSNDWSYMLSNQHLMDNIGTDKFTA